MNRKQLLLIILPIVIIAIIVVAVLPPFITPPQEVRPIRIGMAVALSGGFSRFGQLHAAGLEIWANITNQRGGILGRPVEVIIYDDKSVISNCVELYRKLIYEDKVDFAVGPYATGFALGVAPVFAEAGKLYISGGAIFTKDQFEQVGYEKMFSIYPLGLEEGKNILGAVFRLLMEQNPKPRTIVIQVNNANPFFIDQGQAMKYWAEQYGMEILLYEEYPATLTDFTSLVAKAAALKPDVYMVANNGPDAFPIAQAMQSLSFRPKAVYFTLTVTDITFWQLGEASNGVLGWSVWVPESTPYTNYKDSELLLRTYLEYASRKGIMPYPSYHVAASYAALQVLQQAIEATGSLDDNILANYIRTHTFDTVLGKLSFENRIPDYKGAIVQIQNGKMVIVDHPDPTTLKAPLIYPLK